MRRIANCSAKGQEAPMVITPNAVARVLRQFAGAILRIADRRRTE
jgi:hypothetical protein